MLKHSMISSAEFLKKFKTKSWLLALIPIECGFDISLNRRLGFDCISVHLLLREAVDYIERGFCSRRVLTIAAQTLLSQLQMTLRNRNLVGICRDLIPERLEVTHLFSLR